MGKPISETVAELRDQFLATKSEEYRQKFDQKSLQQQYAAINQWKNSFKNLGMATKNLAKVSATNVVKYLKDAHKKLQKLEELSPKERAKIVAVLDTVKDTLDNFDRKKKEQLLNSYITEKENLNKLNQDLDRKIEELQNQLG